MAKGRGKSNRTCTADLCGEPAPNGYLCSGCVRGLAEDLDQVVWLWEQLDITRVREANLAPAGAMRGASSVPLPWDERASQCQRRIYAALLGLSGELLAPVTPSLFAIVRKTRNRLLDIMRSPYAGTYLSELARCREDALSVINRPTYATRFEVGPCPELLGEGALRRRCPGQVWAMLPARDDVPAVLACRNPECSVVWNSSQWLRAGRRILAEHHRRRQLQLRGVLSAGSLGR